MTIEKEAKETGASVAAEPVVMCDLPDYGDLITIEDFIEYVESGSFIDYDGNGALATETKRSNINIWPSQVGQIEIPDWATHVVWFNR